MQQTAHPALLWLGALRPCGLILTVPLSTYTCLIKRFFFCLTDSPTGVPGHSSEVQASNDNSATALPSCLDKEVQFYHANSFAASTSKTYSTQLLAFLRFCDEIKISPVPLSQENIGRYIAFLSRRLCFNSVKQYLNAVRLVHLEAGLPNPLDKNWYITSILKGVRWVKGDASVQKLPITLDILRQIFLTLNLHNSFDRTFWAAYLVGFFSFFRKSNLLVSSHMLFDQAKNLGSQDVQFTTDGAVLTVRWSKVI